MKTNPLMFVKIGEKHGDGEELFIGGGKMSDSGVELTETEDDSEMIELHCPHCFKMYTDKKWYDKHVLKCSEKADA